MSLGYDSFHQAKMRWFWKLHPLSLNSDNEINHKLVIINVSDEGEINYSVIKNNK